MVQKNNRANCCAKTLLLLGSILMGLGVLAAFLIHKEFPKLIKALAVVDSKHGLGYKSWSGNVGKTGAPRYYSYTFSTIKNKEAFLQGEAPVYEEQGPYVFRTQYKRVGIHFEDHGKAVTFSEKFVNTFDARRSKGSLDDQVNIVNPAWSSIVSSVHSEVNVRKASVGVVLTKLWDSFQDFIKPTSKLDTLQGALIKARDGLNLAMTLLKYPPNSFFAAWGGNCVSSNGTAAEICGLSDLSWVVDAHLLPSKQDRQYIIADLLVNIPFKQRIPLDKALRMWNESDPYSFINLKEINSTLTGHGYFLGLRTWVDAASDDGKAQVLAKHFGITTDQVKTLAKALDSAKDDDTLFQEVRARYVASVPEAKRGLLPELKDSEELLWWQLYTGEVMPALKANPEARLKKEAKFEFGWFAQTMGLTWDQTGVPFKTVYCLFDHADANVSALEDKLFNLGRSWPANKAPEFNTVKARQPKYTFDECFPDEATIMTVQGYLHYLVSLFFTPAYNQDMAHDGLMANKTARAWLLGDGPLSIIQNALRRLDDPRIPFSLMVNDDSLDGEPLCAKAADVSQLYTACYRVDSGKPGQDKFLRGNYTMFTGKDDISKVGQLKRLYGQEVMTGIWAKPLPIVNGGSLMASESPTWEYKPLIAGHTDGIAVPPGVLQDPEALKDGFVSFMVESVSVPVPLVYEGDVERQGIKLRRFVMHPDALTARRPDAATFSMGHPGTPPEMLEVLNLTDIKQLAAYIGAVDTPTLRPRDKLIGRDDAALSPDTVSYIEFEPITGMAMRVNLQIQSYTTTLPQFVKYNVWHPDVYQAPLIPMFKLHIEQDVSPSQARTFRRVVYGAKTVAKASYITGFTAGGVLVLAGIVMLMRARDRKLGALALGKSKPVTDPPAASSNNV